MLLRAHINRAYVGLYVVVLLGVGEYSSAPGTALRRWPLEILSSIITNINIIPV